MLVTPALLSPELIFPPQINFTLSWVSFSVLYFFPMFFEVVKLLPASAAGMHLLPNSVALSIGSLFAGYVSNQCLEVKLSY
jgi:hypothetical protein